MPVGSSCLYASPKIRRQDWWKAEQVYSKVPILREDTGSRVTKTTFSLNPAKSFHRHARKGRTKVNWSGSSQGGPELHFPEEGFFQG